MPPHSHSADRNLLFGIIALQMDFISRDQLIAAMAGWVVEKHKSLGQVLCDQQALAPEDHEAIQSLVRRHLLRHGKDPERSLAALIAIAEGVRGELSSLGDPDVHASLSHVSSTRFDSDSTATYLGSPTTPGGRFRILRPHARGGLGVVSVALDEELHREVALKEIQERYAGEELPRLRFLLEAEITGGLEHPGIVPVYGLGHHPDGRPFYAMRFVRGESLKEAIAQFHGEPGRVSAGSPAANTRGAHASPLAQPDEPVRVSAGSALARNTRGAHATPLAGGADGSSLAFRRLLTRFLDVCNAIAYAHSRGVLHRDIKPGNILLGPFGETLVVDWGLAKVVGQDAPGDSDAGAEGTLRPPSSTGCAATQPGSALGTPAYMSPEQAAGRLDLLGPASDVYSLGATLYAVLTGRAPFDGGDVAEVLPKVERGEFARPRAVGASIPNPLEAICLKAMALKPADRYASPRALAEDIEHWLAGEPVSAYREPWLDRARRWSRKHRTFVTTGAAVLGLGLIGSATLSAVISAKNRELAKETERAEQREQMAINAVDRFRDVVVEEPELKNNPALEALRKKLLKEPLAFFKSLREQLQATNDSRPTALARLANAAHDYAHLSDEIGNIQDSLTAHAESLAAWEKIAREHPANPDCQYGLARIENCRANMLVRTGHSDQALTSYSKAQAIHERLAIENPRVVRHQVALAISQSNIGTLQSRTGQAEEALASYGKALAIYERLARENPAEAEPYIDYEAQLYQNLGRVQRETGRYYVALASYQKAIAIDERLARGNPSDTKYLHDLAESYVGLGVLQIDVGDVQAALDSYHKALEIQERLARENGRVIGFQQAVANNHNDIGVLQGKMNRREQALDSFRKAAAICERLVKENPAIIDLKRILGSAYNNIGNTSKELGRFEQAFAWFGKALSVQQQLAKDHPNETGMQDSLAKVYQNIASLHGRMGHPNEALEPGRKALTIRDRLARENPTVTDFQFNLARSLYSVAGVQRSLELPDQALESYGKAMAIQERLANQHPESPEFASDLAATLHNSALLDRIAKRFDLERDKLRRAVRLQKKALATNPADPTYRFFLQGHLQALITVAGALGKADEAAAARRELDELVASDPRTVQLDEHLSAVARDETPKDNSERLQLAYWASRRGLRPLSARLFAEALQTDPKLGDDRQAQHRYNAACAAALAAASGTGPPDRKETSGRTEKPLTDADRAKFRNQARTWLEAELATWTKLLASASREQRQTIAGTLKNWQQDTDLASVRGESALAKMPDDERKAWRALWADVDALLAKASKP
jgi:serine/threonine-protein kinase